MTELELTQRLQKTHQELLQAQSRIAELEAQLKRAAPPSPTSQFESAGGQNKAPVQYEALHAGLELYQNLIESADTSISLVNSAGQYIYLNAIAAEFFHAQPSLLVGKTIRDLYQPAESERFLSYIQQVLNTNKGLVLESEIAYDNQSRWFRISMQPVHDSTAIPYAVLMNATDITEHKYAEESLHQSETYLRSLVDSQTAYSLRVG